MAKKTSSSTSDIVSPAKRREMMRAVRRSGTAPELAIRKIVRGLGARYRLNHPSLPGRPDLANRSAGWAIFVHGCFWHGHRNCKKTKGGRTGRIPKSNADKWRSKIEANRTRDRLKARELKGLGLRVLTIWECELRHLPQVVRKLSNFLDRRP